MKTSDMLYNINTYLSVFIAKEKDLDLEQLEKLNLRLGEIIKEIRELEKK